MSSAAFAVEHPRTLAVLCPFICTVPRHIHNELPFFALNASALLAFAATHGLTVDAGGSPDAVRSAVLQHVFSGSCAEEHRAVTHPACQYLRELTTPLLLARELCSVAAAAGTKQIGTPDLLAICKALQLRVDSSDTRRLRRTLQTSLRSHISQLDMCMNYQRCEVSELLRGFETKPASQLNEIAAHHSLDFSSKNTSHRLRDALSEHFASGACHTEHASTSAQAVEPPGCADVRQQFSENQGEACPDNTQMQIFLLSVIVHRASFGTLKRVLSIQSVPFETSDSLSKLRRRLKKYIRTLRKGKFVVGRTASGDQSSESQHTHAGVSMPDHSAWPQVLTEEQKCDLLKAFRHTTGKSALSQFVCGSCHAQYPLGDKKNFVLDEEGVSMFLVHERPDIFTTYTSLDGQQTLLHAGAVLSDSPDGISISVCRDCRQALARRKMPPLAVANNLSLGAIPPELRELTMVEEAMIARCRAKAWIVQLKQDKEEEGLPGAHRPWAQQGMRGHIITYPQHVEHIASLLPPSLEEISERIAIIFVGAKLPDAEWLRTKAKPLSVRADRVRAALVWLKENNPLYRDIQLNEDILARLRDDPTLPLHIQHVLPNRASDNLTSRYDTNADSRSSEAQDGPGGSQPAQEPDIVFQNVVITDVEGRVSSNDLRAAAIRHMKVGGGAVHIHHDPVPADMFKNATLFPMIYPVLFPYGVGGFDRSRQAKLSMKRQVKHFLNLNDRRFQEHPTFMFTAFSILQRRSILLQAKLKVDRSSFASVAEDIAATSLEAVQRISERAAAGEHIVPKDDEERRVLRLMREVKVLNSKVPASAAAKLSMRNEIRGLMMTKGMPSWYITVNPADVYNPIVQFLAGEEIDVDKLLPDQVPQFFPQSILVAKNPVVASKFFNLYMHAFIKTLLGYDPKADISGLLGRVSAFYGCVEAQGRGTLHCHMLVWIEGALNPNEIKEKVLADLNGEFQKRLLAALDDIIANCVPEDPPEVTVPLPSSAHHACSVRGPDLSLPADVLAPARKRDLRNVVLKSQMHTHSGTCYKYWKAPEPMVCRFDLDESNFCAESSFDPETGEINLRCLDGLVNNYNPTMLEALRCNMDIKFIGSGSSAKAILYYVTDYITKSPLKSHVSYAALETAVRRLSEREVEQPFPTAVDKAKSLLQKCAYAMISHQELSAQQVASYLTDEEDHFTSHKFTNLYWPSFERHINSQDPSPECDYRQAESDNDPEVSPPEPADIPDLAAVDADDSDSDTGSTVGQDDEPNPDENEVMITVDDSGEIRPRGGQLSDYLCRGPALKNVCLWDQICYFDKVSRKSLRRKPVPDDESDSDVDPDEDGDAEEPIMAVLDRFDVFTEMANTRSRKRPISALLHPHMEMDSHVLRLREARVPVPIGPALPRRDVPGTFPRYCRLMLILFKPWRIPSDLRSAGQSWEHAFNEFRSTCRSEHLKIMDNMQVLHECKDSRDDHFKNGRPRRNRSQRVSGEMARGAAGADDFADSDDYQDAIAEHLQSVDHARSDAKLLEQKTAIECLFHANLNGVFHHDQTAPFQAHESGTLTQILPDQLTVEHLWKQEYDKRRTALKKAAAQHPPAPTPDLTVPNANVRREHHAETEEMPSIASHIVMGQPPEQDDPMVTPEDIIAKWSLNTEQARAFQLVADQTLAVGLSPLRMMLSGPGGTGKSRVIHALKDWFDSRNQSRRFRLASYTGVAARNISGMTLHAALCLSRTKSGGSDLRSRRDLAAMWEGVDFLFIDEVSMVGCNLMVDVSEALCDAKGCSEPFGGINVIFAGDFCQLPPVLQPRLFKRLDVRTVAQGGTAYGQKSIQGKLLWLSVRSVVILTEQMRQAGPENLPFVELLGRLREGRCTQEDYRVLKTREIGALRQSLTASEWQTLRRAPIIVAENAAKDALNIRAAEHFAESTGQELQWYYSLDTYRGQPITDPRIVDALDRMHSGTTNPQMMRKLPLVPGMPVIVTQNFAVDAGVVNGSRGILKSVRYFLDQHGRRHATSCTVLIPTSSPARFLELDSHVFPILEETADIKITHRFSGKTCTLRRKQIPLLPGFAMTAHKAQGESMDNVMIDLQGCKGSEAPYVMASRVRSLAGLLILRPFDYSKISCRNSQDLRGELSRLSSLAAGSQDSSLPNSDLGEADESTQRGPNELLAEFQGESAETTYIPRAQRRRGRQAEEDARNNDIDPRPRKRQRRAPRG